MLAEHYIFIPSDLDLWPSDLKSAHLVILVLGHISTKLEVSVTFLFLDDRRHGKMDGQTDGQSATLSAAP